MPLEIVSYRMRRERHGHKCPMGCKRTVLEPNDVCGKTSGDHIFPCMACLGNSRRRFSDIVLDAYLEPDQFSRLKEVSPDHVSDELDARDEDRRRQQFQEIAQKAQQNPEAYRKRTPQEIAAAKKEALDEMAQLATVLTEDEIMEEIKKIKEDERL